MQIGKLRHKIDIQTRLQPDTQDGYGEASNEWATVETVWASIEPASGKQLYVAEQLQAEISHVVTIRYYDGLTEKYRFKYGSRILNINFVRNVEERNIYMQVYCKEAL